MTAASTAQLTKDTSTLVIRPLQEQDIALLPLGENSDDTRAYMNKIMERNDWSHTGIRVFVAELVAAEGDADHVKEETTTATLVGYAYVGLGYPPYFPAIPETTKQLYLADLNVFEPFRRRGFALRMLAFLKSEAQRLELDLFRAECEKGWHVDMYARIGFTPVPYKGPRTDYPDSHQMLELWLEGERTNKLASFSAEISFQQLHKCN